MGFEANISPTRAAAPACHNALAAQQYYLPANQNSGGGRTEETRDRVNQQQIDRSRNNNRTRARGTEITAGTTSADGWTTVPTERQVAAVEMRVGQNGGPLPFEAIIDFGEPIINGASGKKIILDKENQDGGAKNFVFQLRGTSTGNRQIDERASFGWVTVARDQRRERTNHQPKAVLHPTGEARLAEGSERQIDERASFGWITVAQDQRRERTNHQPKAVLHPTGDARLAEELEQRRGACNSFYAKAHGGGGGRDGGWGREGRRLGRAVRRENGVKPGQVLRLRAASLWAGEAPVEMEGTKATRLIAEPMTATAIAQTGTICSEFKPNKVLRFPAARLSGGEEPLTAGTRREDFGPPSTCWRCTATAETEPEETSLPTNVAWSSPPTKAL